MKQVTFQIAFKMSQGKHPIDLFLYSHYDDLMTAAADIGVTYQTLRKWKEKPENLLKYLLVICDRTGCESEDVIEVTKKSLRYLAEE